MSASPRVSAFGAGAALALGAQTLVGSSFAAMKPIADFPFALGQAGRYVVAVALMLVIARGRVGRPRPADLAVLAVVAFTGLVLFNVFSLKGVAHSDAASVGVVVGCVPILLAFLGPLQRGETPSAKLVAAGVVVAAGAALAQLSGARPTWVGFALAFGALLCEAAFTLLPVPLLPRLGAMGVSVWTCALGAVMLALWALADPGVWRTPHVAEATALAWLAVGVTTVAFLCWYAAVGRIGADRAGLFCGVVPISAALAAWLVAGDAVRPLQAVGAVVVAVGVTLGMRAARRPPSPPVAAP